jgi:hypothetical protein
VSAMAIAKQASESPNISLDLDLDPYTMLVALLASFPEHMRLSDLYSMIISLGSALSKETDFHIPNLTSRLFARILNEGIRRGDLQYNEGFLKLSPLFRHHAKETLHDFQSRIRVALAAA